jgi:bifunctional DNase/RNase
MLIRMRVKTVTHTPGASTAIVVLETLTDDRTLGLTVPLDEASRLGRVLGLGPGRCAPIYDLVDALVAALGTAITRAVLDARDDGIGACLTFGDASLTVACHPADALALAARGEVPVFARADALACACPAGPHDHPAAPPPTEIPAAPSNEGERDLTAWLSGLRPAADFAVEPRRPPGDPPEASADTTT